MRKSGVLMHISSLSDPYGIGTLGNAAREFVDFLHEAGQSFWQVLPICPTGYGDSPYQSFSCEAGNPYFIDPDELARQGLLEKKDYQNRAWGKDPARVDYGALYRERFAVLFRAAKTYLEDPSDDYESFLRENASWIDDYAVFMTLKNCNGGKSWYEWEKPFKERDGEAMGAFRAQHAGEIEIWKVIQYFFFRQWFALKKYANRKGIRIIGDLPIYVAQDSVSVWTRRQLFQLDEDGMPKEVSGCPPDGFSAAGQLWGNPLYDWEYMKQDHYAWWTARIDYLCRVFDVLRIDHFRGFESYYAIPAGDATAQNGRWRPGPGIALFDCVRDAIGKKDIIAENLGYLTPGVEKLLKESGFPGMKVVQFCFDERDSDGDRSLPHCFEENCVAYIGTHDNDTALGWLKSARPEDTDRAIEYMHLNEDEGYGWGMLRTLWGTKAGITIAQAQDLLELGSEARMNIPSGQKGNWVWRALPGDFTPELAQKLRDLTLQYDRL